MIGWTRTTTWHDERGDLRQVSVCLLDPITRDPLREVTEQAGPFDEPQDVHRRALARLEEWVRIFGIQQELALD